MDYDYLKYKKILIVDDEADLREMVTSILEQDGFKTIKTAGTCLLYTSDAADD